MLLNPFFRISDYTKTPLIKEAAKYKNTELISVSFGAIVFCIGVLRDAVRVSGLV